MPYSDPERQKQYWRERARLPGPTAIRKAYVKANAEKVRAYMTEYRQRNRDKFNEANRRYERSELGRAARRRKQVTQAHRMRAACARRRAAKLNATPAWADRQAIAAVYAEAAAKGMHVDHIVPLKSKLVCGLHVPWNLQVLPGPENIRKSNRFWPGMP